MKPRRTSLPFESAAKGSVPAPAAASSTLDASPSPAAALRERLTQTRARMARTPPQIHIEWDPEELPTRRYSDDFLASWRHGRAYPASPEPARARIGSAEVPRAVDPRSLHQQRSTELPNTRPRGRVRSGEVPIGTVIDREAPERTASPRGRSTELPIDASDPHAPERTAPPGARSTELPIGASDRHALETRPPGALSAYPHARERTAPPRARSTELPIDASDPHALERTAPPGALSAYPHAPERTAPPRARSADRHAPERRASARARSGEVLAGTHFGEAAYVEQDPSGALNPADFPGGRSRRQMRDAMATPLRPLTLEPAAVHIAPISTRATRPPLTTLLRKEVSALAEHMQALYASVDRSDRAMRDRVTLCSGALLLAAALFALFAHNRTEPRTDPQPAAAIAPSAAPPTASISVSSDPPGAQIFVDGQASGKVTPTAITGLTPGRHRLGLQLAGYSEATEALHVPEDALLSIKLAALSAPRSAPPALENRPQTRAEARAQARALARERRAAARAARVLSRYRARMGLAPELIDPDAAKSR